MKAGEITTIIFGIALTNEIPKEERKELINAVLQTTLGITLSKESE